MSAQHGNTNRSEAGLEPEGLALLARLRHHRYGTVLIFDRDRSTHVLHRDSSERRLGVRLASDPCETDGAVAGNHSGAALHAAQIDASETGLDRCRAAGRISD